MSDLISRQAAIDAIDVLCQEHRYKIPGKRETYSQYNEAWQDALDRAEGAIFNLPSVQPDHVADTGRKVEQTGEIAQSVQDEDLISRKAAIEALARMMPRSYTPDGSHPGDEEIFRAQEVFADCIEALEILPSAQPEIIRCKDCDWWTKQEDSVQGRCELMQMYPAGRVVLRKRTKEAGMRLIDADAFKAYMRGALEQTRRCYPDGGEWAEAVTEEFCRDIDEQPTIEPQRKKGEWIYNSPVTMKCNQCGLVIKDWDWHRFKYCPNCGADMRGEQNG